MIRRSVSLAADLLSLIKPRIVALLCLTGLATLFAAGGAPVPVVLGFAAAGGCIAASAAAFNCYYDRTLDRHMERTADRPLPSGRLDPRIALGFAFGLCLLGSTIGFAVLPLVSVVYMWLGIAAYVGLYTVLLKRRHWLGVVLGGSAGSFPVLAGWTAVEPLALEAVVLAIVVFAWTPAHAWALAYVYRNEFSAASVPTLPAIASRERVRRAVWVSVWATLAVAAIAVPFTAPPYATTLVVAGGCLVIGYFQFYRDGTEAAAVRAFFTSNLFLAVLFLAWGINGVVGTSAIWLRLGTVVALPIAFYRLWTLRLSLRGVAGATGDEWVLLRRHLSKKATYSPGEDARGEIHGDSERRFD